jgi:hypothetical protein
MVWLLFEHDLFRKPVPTFRDRALELREGTIRNLVAILLSCVFAFAHAPAFAAPRPALEFTSRDNMLRWIATYRASPEPARMPELLRAASRGGAFGDPDSTGAYIGFFAGVLGANPQRADELVDAMYPVQPEDQWVIVRAIAYSGLPDWKERLKAQEERLPTRKAMIGKFIDGRLPTLSALGPKSEPSGWEKTKRLFGAGEKKGPSATWAMDASPELLDVLWGYYFATGGYGPVARMIALLPWSKDRDNADRLLIGSMTKFTLATNASRDPALLTLLKRAAPSRGSEERTVLQDIIEAADTMELTRIRKEQMAAIEEIKRKGPGYKRELSGWGQLGEGAIGVGCVTAAVMSMTALGIPCVVGGAAASAGLRYWTNQQ